MYILLRFVFTLGMICVLIPGPGLYADPGGAVIEGRVLDAGTKRPLPSVNVVIVHSNVGAATDQNGYYRISNVPPGTVRLEATMIGYQRAHRVVSTEPGELLTADFVLESTVLEMGAVVVTGTATPHLTEDTPVRTEVIPRRLIERKQAINLADALEFHTGVQVENTCQNCNASQVRILGMDGKYSQILIDGDPVMGSLTGVYGLEQLPEEMVDQIEIVKGGGSSLYGGGAIAGVINVITRRPLVNQVRIKFTGQSMGGEFDQHVGAVAERVNRTGSSGAYVFGSFRKRNPYDRNKDGFSELAALNNGSMGFKWYYKPLENGELLTSFHRIHEDRRGGSQFDLPVHDAEIAEWTEHRRSGGSIRWSQRPGTRFDYRAFYSFSLENRKSYYGGRAGDSPEERLEALSYYGRTENPLQIGGVQANYQLRGHLLTAGAQYTRDRVRDETAAETVYHLNKTYTNTGFFLQDNLHFGSRNEIEFVLGGRIDSHSELTRWIFSPRMNAKWNPAEGFTLRASATTGFKPPQTYDEDLHLCGLEGDQRIIRNAADLREERSHTLSAGLEYLGTLNKIPVMASVTVFKTRIRDSFTERFVSREGGTERWERVNSDGAGVKGVEWDWGVRPLPAVEIRSGFTWIQGRFDSPHEDFHTRHFLRMPDLTGNIRCTVTASDRLEVFLAGGYLGEADVPRQVIVKEQDDPELRLERGARFFQCDAGVIFRLPIDNGLNARISAGVRNLTDAYQKDLDWGPERDPAYVYGPTRPRTFYFGLETAF
ncbi:MAG TPA: TonB-dependent receptor [bacterium]|nr:TonB-dependent receptor [bacterium]